MKSSRIAAVVLAAGSSSRMGCPKQLVEIEGQPLIRRTVQTVLTSQVDRVIVTAAPANKALSAALEGLEWTRGEVQNPELGQSESIRAGLRLVESIGDADAILFTPCDLPLLSTTHLNALIGKYQNSSWGIVASRYSDVLGAPLIIGRVLWSEIRELKGDVGIRKIIKVHPQTTTFIEWEEGHFDLDTPEDVQALTKLLANEHHSPTHLTK